MAVCARDGEAQREMNRKLNKKRGTEKRESREEGKRRERENARGTENLADAPCQPNTKAGPRDRPSSCGRLSKNTLYHGQGYTGIKKRHCIPPPLVRLQDKPVG